MERLVPPAPRTSDVSGCPEITSSHRSRVLSVEVMEQSSWPVLTLLTLCQLVTNIDNVQITDILLPDTFQGNNQLPASSQASSSSL